MESSDFSNRLLPSSSLKIISNLLTNQIQTVIDVGVQYQTKCLIDTFPQAFHYLFEPALCYHDNIKGLYASKNIKHELIPVAVSDIESIHFQHILGCDETGSATHTQLLPLPNKASFGDKLISIHETKVITLDNYFSNNKLNEPYIVKIDVDGIEEKIIAGAAKVIRNAAIVMLECPTSLFSRRLRLLEDLNHQLFDIVGQAYYYNQLSQFDIITISKNLISSNIDLRPWEKSKGKVNWNEWRSFN